MDKDAWADFLEANDAHALTLTLTLAQRNLIAEADQYIERLEDRASDLLGACEAAEACFKHWELSSAEQRTVGLLRAAIAKARGESS